MTTKKLSLVYGTNLNYKLIRDGYKTVNGSVVVDENTPKTISLEAPQEIYSLPDIININTDTESAPIVALTEDLELPDGIVNSKQEYILGEYGKKYIISDNIRYNNFSISGNILIDNNHIASGFSTSNYLRLKSIDFDNANTWEIMFKVNTGILNNFCDILHFSIDDSDSGRYGIVLRTDDTFKFVWQLSSNGSSWDIEPTTSNSIIAENNTDYYVRLIFDGTKYTYEISKDNIEWQLAAECITTTKILNGLKAFKIGMYNNAADTVWKGSIDLSETYIKLDNEIVWKPQCSSFARNYRTGSAILDENNILSNLTSNIIIPYFTPKTDTWEFNTKFKTGTDLNTLHNQILHNMTRGYAMAITKYHSDGYPMSSYINNAWTEGTVAMELSTDYWFKFKCINKTCYLYVKRYEEGEIECPATKDMALSCTVIANDSFINNELCFSVSGDQYWSGTIDLNHTYFLENGIKYNLLSFKQCNFGTYAVGRPTINSDYVTWNCNSSNYYTMNVDLTGYNTFEVYMKIQTPNGAETNGAFFSNNTTGASPFRRDDVLLSSWSSAQYISGGYTMSNNTSHWIKGYSDGTTWYLYGKPAKDETVEEITSSEDWILAGSCSASNMISSGINNFIFGRNTNTYNNQYFTGKFDLSCILMKKDSDVILQGVLQKGKELCGILNSLIKDVSEEKTYNLYDVQTDVRSLILSEDKNINADNIEFIEYCGQVTIPSHTVYEYDTANSIWSNLPVTINYNIPEEATITINENIVTSSPYITDEIGELVYKVNKEGYEEYIGQIDYTFGGSTYEITITEDDMISNSSSEGPSISPDTPSLTRQYYAFTPTNNAFLTSANTNGNVNGDTSTFYATSEEVGTHQVLYMLNPETGNMIEITNVELVISSSSLEVYPLTTGPLFFMPPKQTDAIRNSAKDIVANATPEASTTATIVYDSIIQ